MCGPAGPEGRSRIMAANTYSVPDVSCNHCKMAIENAVGALDGVSKVEVDVEGKTVTLSYDDKAVAEETVLDTLAKEGYPVAG